MARKRNHKTTLKRNVFASPGTLTYIGREINSKTTMQLVEYNELFEKIIPLKTIDYFIENDNLNHINWLEIDGCHEVQVVAEIGTRLQIHPLIQEDILNTLSKPRIEFFNNEAIYVLMKTVDFDADLLELKVEQVGLILISANQLISFQEQNETDVFKTIVDRIKGSIGKTRKNEADYLLYALMDLIVDNYFLTLEKITEKLEEIEDCIFIEPNNQHQTQLYTIKRQLSIFRKNVFPMREVLLSLINESSVSIGSNTTVYLRDLQDHVVQILDGIESNREVVDSLMNFYLSQLSNRMNSVMKTLTVFTAIFMPLSFIVGLYGMNFENMPELKNPNGYYYAIAAMFSISIGLFGYFKWKKYV
jgi:magnesium transporter